MAGVDLIMEWKDETYYCKTGDDGFFRFNWKDKPPLPCGWNNVIIKAYNGNEVIAQSTGTVYVPHETQYGFISDIDDTFLISHSANMRKRLFVLFTENARSRQPFEDAVKHYQLLANSNTSPEHAKSFLLCFQQRMEFV